MTWLHTLRYAFLILLVAASGGLVFLAISRDA
jgi:hypothetical protein